MLSTRITTTTRALLLAALLAVCALQVLETQHLHNAGSFQPDCVLCHAPAATAPGSAAALPVPPAVVHAVPPLQHAIPLISPVRKQLARAPPAIA